MCGGWALVRQGHPQEGLERIRSGVGQFRDTGRKTWLAWWIMLQAEAQLMNRDASGALSTVDEGLGAIGAIGERQFESPATSLKGNILEALDRPGDAERCFLSAIEIARSQSAKSWELRAATSLARLWQSQSKTTEARDLLAPVYGWFTEGFDTADLKEAKALLDKLEPR